MASNDEVKSSLEPNELHQIKNEEQPKKENLGLKEVNLLNYQIF